MRCPFLDELPPPPQGKSGWPWTEATPRLPSTMPNGLPWPTITIVTPSYNQEQFVEETIRSVLLQGYPNLEYIVMDGGSKDSTPDIIHKYTKWFAYWRSQKDDGQAAAISEGFDRSQGSTLGWLNSDDVLLPGCLQSAAEYLAEYDESDCVVGGTIVIDKDDRIIRNPLGLPRIVRGTRSTFTEMLVCKGFDFYQAASFWRREAYLAVGGLDTALNFTMDYDLYLKLARAKPLGHVNQILACFRVHADSKTTTLQSVRHRETAQLMDRYGGNAIPSFWGALCRTYLLLVYVVHNLPLRVGVASGLVSLPGHYPMRSGR